ncbi:MAG: hypothetical protein V1816_25960 [Pseudomonadota bacterium]
MGLIRWIIIIFLFFMIYRVLKGLMNPSSSRDRQRDRFGSSGPSPEEAGEQNIQDLARDPHTGVYFPRSEGIASLIDGQVMYFLNAECRDKYLQARGNKTGGR